MISDSMSETLVSYGITVKKTIYSRPLPGNIIITISSKYNLSVLPCLDNKSVPFCPFFSLFCVEQFCLTHIDNMYNVTQYC